MRLLHKNTSAVSEAIFREQRQLRKERLLASPGLIIGFVGFVIILMSAVLVPALSNADPNAMIVVDRLKPPSGEHILGTDEFGRDLFVRLMYGARVSLWVGGCVAVFSCILGVILGIYASYFKILDHILMRICDGLIAIPGILLAIALIAALGTSSWNVVVALTIVYTPSVARTVRASAMVVREQPYVEAARVQGFSHFRILWKLILPGVVSPLTVQASFIFA
ncbi:MAG: ABC transporter permease, partial [Lachnospiraceae bacterium]|nr:ABC transporter permease [Lachnospiraceae bacterium]